MALRLAAELRRAGLSCPDAAALSGGCFQNRLLFEQAVEALQGAGFDVLSHAETPANDGGLALGQAAVAAARVTSDKSFGSGGEPCASAFQAAS